MPAPGAMANGEGPHEVEVDSEGGAHVPPNPAVLDTRRGAGMSFTSSAPAERAADPRACPAVTGGLDLRLVATEGADSSMVSKPLTTRGRPIGSIGPMGSGLL
jgi:hypothetical protein